MNVRGSEIPNRGTQSVYGNWCMDFPIGKMIKSSGRCQWKLRNYKHLAEGIVVNSTKLRTAVIRVRQKRANKHILLEERSSISKVAFSNEPPDNSGVPRMARAVFSLPPWALGVQ